MPSKYEPGKQGSQKKLPAIKKQGAGAVRPQQQLPQKQPQQLRQNPSVTYPAVGYDAFDEQAYAAQIAAWWQYCCWPGPTGPISTTHKPNPMKQP